jgi:hypothetical protein
MKFFKKFGFGLENSKNLQLKLFTIKTVQKLISCSHFWSRFWSHFWSLKSEVISEVNSAKFETDSSQSDLDILDFVISAVASGVWHDVVGGAW